MANKCKLYTYDDSPHSTSEFKATARAQSDVIASTCSSSCPQCCVLGKESRNMKGNVHVSTGKFRYESSVFIRSV
jgi:hypothetical protein